MGNITGGCLCGRIRYTITGEPERSYLCHCRNCQRYTGSAFETVIRFLTASVGVRGELKTYDDTGDTGQKVRRRFCPNCGSGVIAEADALPGITIVLVGTLDDPAVFQPTLEIYCNSAQPWTLAGGDRKRFPQGANAGPNPTRRMAKR
jgi:hypothetical protein